VAAACLTPYQYLLGDAYHRLHPHVRLAHEAPLAATGAVDVVHGSHPLTPLIVRAMKLPAAGSAQPVLLHVTSAAAGMIWTRRIGDTVLDTRQFARQGRLVERSGPGTVEFVLRVDDGALVYAPAGCRLLEVPLPRPPAPRVNARVAPTAEGWRVEVVVEWGGHLVCRYAGAMRPSHSTS
jgi:hypothetical protein